MLAFALSQQGAWLLCAPDKAAILSAHRLSFLHRVLALEEMALAAGVRKQGYGLNHTKLTFWGQTILRTPQRCEERIWRLNGPGIPCSNPP